MQDKLFAIVAMCQQFPHIFLTQILRPNCAGEKRNVFSPTLFYDSKGLRDNNNSEKMDNFVSSNLTSYIINIKSKYFFL